MDMFFAVVHVWHFWIAIVMVLGSIAGVLAIVGLYAAKVSRTRFPNSDS